MGKKMTNPRRIACVFFVQIDRRGAYLAVKRYFHAGSTAICILRSSGGEGRRTDSGSAVKPERGSFDGGSRIRGSEAVYLKKVLMYATIGIL